MLDALIRETGAAEIGIVFRIVADQRIRQRRQIARRRDLIVVGKPGRLRKVVRAMPSRRAFWFIMLTKRASDPPIPSARTMAASLADLVTAPGSRARS